MGPPFQSHGNSRRTQFDDRKIIHFGVDSVAVSSAGVPPFLPSGNGQASSGGFPGIVLFGEVYAAKPVSSRVD